MPTPALPTPFLFIAVTPTGGKKVGVRAAPDARSLTENLRRDHLLLLRSWKLPAWTVSAGDLSLKDQASLNEQLAMLLRRGVPLVEALEVASTVVRPAAAGKCLRLRELVSSGSSFADACQNVGGFDAISIAVYRAAQRTGDLGVAAERLATAARRRVAIAGKAGTVLIYPAVVLAISIIAVTVMLTVVVPQIGNALLDADLTLPAYTVVVLGIGTFLRSNLLWFIVGFGVLLGLAIAFRRTAFAGLVAVMSRLRPIARLKLSVEAARFFSVMAAMSRSGVPVADALATSTRAISHEKLRGQLDKLQRELVQGGLLRNLLEDVNALPLATRRLLIAAERSGDLDTAFDSLATDLADEVDTRSERLLALLEPLVIVLMFVFIGAVLMAIMIPLITMSGQVGGG